MTTTVFFPAGAPNQSVGGTLASVNDAVTLATDSLGSVDFALAGTPVGATVAFEGTSDGTTWYAMKAYPKVPGAAGSTTANAAGSYNVTVGGAAKVRARLTAITSGSFTCVANGTIQAGHVGVKNGNAADLQVNPQDLGAAPMQVAQQRDLLMQGIAFNSGPATLFTLDMTGYDKLSVMFFGGNSVASFSFEGANDLSQANWEALSAEPDNANYAPIPLRSFKPNTTGPMSWTVDKRTRFIRLRYDQQGSGVYAWRASASLGQLSRRSAPSAESSWSYAAGSGGIVNTSAVVAKAAGQAGERQYIKSAQFSNSGAAGTEAMILDGAAVLWRGWVPAATGLPAILFDPPLRGSPATAVNVQLSSGTTVAVYANIQGVTAQ